MNSLIKNSDGSYTIDGRVYVLSTIETEKESVFAEMVKDLTRKEDREKYPDSVFWLDKDGQFMFEHDEKKGYFWCSHTNVWSVFESKLGMDYDEIKAFMKGMVEQHFKCKGVTTVFEALFERYSVEEHFKCKGVTTPTATLLTPAGGGAF